MMTRREFAKYLAAITAGAAALPQQLAAFERLYEVNLPRVETGLVSINDVCVSFTGEAADIAYNVEFLEGDRYLLGFTLNRRATYRWVNAPDSPLLAIGSDVHWRVQTLSSWFPKEGQNRDPAEDLAGTIRFTDQDGLIHNQRLSGAIGRLEL